MRKRRRKRCVCSQLGEPAEFVTCCLERGRLPRSQLRWAPIPRPRRCHGSTAPRVEKVSRRRKKTWNCRVCPAAAAPRSSGDSFCS